MILLFLGSVRATFAVLLPFPSPRCLLSSRRRLYQHHGPGGLALAFSRLIDTPSWCSKISSAIWRWEKPARGGRNRRHGSSLAVLAATFTTSIVFFPVALLYGVSQYLFTALALTSSSPSLLPTSLP